MSNTIFDRYVYQKRNSIPNEICDKIIEYFEGEEGRYKGITSEGLNEDVKKTMDFIIPNEDDEQTKWSSIINILTSQLQENITEYMTSLKSHPNFISDNYRFLYAKYLTEDNYQIQKYKKGEGRYVYHEDGSIDWERQRYRVITFLWYLNDVVEGGETEILGDIIVKPERGKLLLFPACWTFPHRGKMPISNDKYIITGWFYVNRTEEL
jgi:hypothetical protein